MASLNHKVCFITIGKWIKIFFILLLYFVFTTSYTKECEQAKKARDGQIELLNDLLKMKGTETLNLQKEKQEILQSKTSEMEDLQKRLSEKDDKILELEKYLETDYNKFHQSEKSQNAEEELKRKEEEMSKLHCELQQKETKIEKLETDRYPISSQ